MSGDREATCKKCTCGHALNRNLSGIPVACGGDAVTWERWRSCELIVAGAHYPPRPGVEDCFEM